MSPKDRLEELAKAQSLNLDSIQFAQYMDSEDELKDFRDEFEFPTLDSVPCETIGDPNQKVIYLLGNSLGLKPKLADRYMKEQLDNWGKTAIHMHFKGRVPAAYADQPAKEITARIVGAVDPAEVAIMNGLTVNLHLLMLAFYRPINNRNKILIEDYAFPSDRYAARSLLRLMKVPEDRLIQIKPKPGQSTLRTEDIIECIENEKDELALIMLPGVQYYTGQKLDMKTITRVGKSHGIPVGFDLAHAVGNVELNLHDWNVDFATWCSYKYLNSGPGGISGIFIHKNHHDKMPDHLEGWWGNAQETRFEMRDHIDSAIGAESFRLCNPPPFLACLNLASLEIVDKAGLEKMRKKQYLLTGYLEYLLFKKLNDKLTILTPTNPEERGCQLSICFNMDVDKVNQKLSSRGVICDTRGRVMRAAPVPLYNTYQDVYNFVNILKQCLQ